jgi:hypothetical protein
MKIKHSFIALAITVLLVASSLIAAIPIQTVAAQYITGNPKQNYTGGPMPSGVTPNTTVETIPYMSLSPNPIGVGQLLLVNLWVQPATQMNRAHTGYTVTLTKPDGTKDIVGPLNSYTADATAWFTYNVDQAGTWQVQFTFAGDYYPSGYYYNGLVYPSLAAIGPYTVSGFSGPTYMASAYYKPSSTDVMDLTVQNDMVASWPIAKLPNDYWTRPVSPINREWASIIGDYPYIGYMNNPPSNTNPYASNYKFTPYVQGPNSCHIVWNRQGALASIMGGDTGKKTIGSGEGTYAGTPSIIFEGRCYQTVTKPMMQLINGTYQSWPTSVWECYDLRTGQVYWDLTGVTAATAISYVGGAVAVPGATATQTGTSANLVSISGGRLIKYNPETGAISLNVSISVSSGTIYCDPYVLSVQTLGSGASTSYWLINWTMAGSDTDFKARIISNITWPFSALGTCDYNSAIAVTTLSDTPNATGVATQVYIEAASLTTGKLLWNVSSEVGYPLFSQATACADHGKFAVRFDNGHWYCWDLNSGKRIWQSEKESMPWGTFGAYNVASAYGLLYDFTYAGLYAIDWNTGQIAWHFLAPCTPFESPWYPSMSFFGAAPQIADGKLYISNGEHSPTSPIARGWTLYCVNATSGQEIWDISSRGNCGGISDGYLTFDSVYTGYMYVFGKGPSITTVTAPDTAISSGTEITIRGTVMDMSQGDQGSFSNPVASPDSFTKPGTIPCVSADSMKTMMEYKYMQFPIDGIWNNATITGVPVSLDTIDPNGNSVHIGDVTTDGYSGTFGFVWQPEIAGKYQITATFIGDDSYGSSFATTYASVSAPASTPQPTTDANPVDVTTPVATYVTAGVIAIIIAIAIVGALIMLAIRKKQ